MTTDNPFASPSAQPGAPALAGDPTLDGEAWSEGETLFTSPEATLPLVCAKCGTREDVEHVALKAQWTPMWARLTIILSPLVYLIVFFIVRKRCKVQVGLCGTHRTQRLIGLVGGIGLILAGLAGMFLGVFLDMHELVPIGMVGGLVVMIVGLVLAVVLAMPLKIVRVTKEYAEFKGAHGELLRAVG